MALDQFRENVFDIVGGEAANERLLGLASGSRESLQETGASLVRSVSDEKQRAKERSRRATSDAVFIDMLQQRMNDLGERLGAIQARNQDLEDELRAEYGEDYLEDMALTYLSDEQQQCLEGLPPEQRAGAIRQMLIDQMINDDGSIKEEYRGITIGELAQGWREEQQIRQRMNNLEVAYESGDIDAIEKALSADNQATLAAQNAIAGRQNGKLGGTFETAAINGDETTIAVAKNRDSQLDADENTNSSDAFAGFDAFSKT